MGKVGIFQYKIQPKKKYTTEELMNLVGGNTGNLLFWYALEKILHIESIPIYAVGDQNVDIDDYQAFVTTDLIWMREEQPEASIQYIHKVLDRIGDRPLIPISLGIQASNVKYKFKMQPSLVALLKRMEERCVLGVRGYYAAEILNKHGINNICPIGCPSMYLPMDSSYQLHKKPYKTRLKTIATASTFYTKLGTGLNDFLLYCADRKMPFVEQTDRPLRPEYVNDSSDCDKLLKWLDRQSKIFYSAEKWSVWASKKHFFMGGRFHGNMIAVDNGVPALFLLSDSRTQELCEFLHLPSLHIQKFDPRLSLEHYYQMADYTNYNKNYKEKTLNFVNFLESNSLSHNIITP